MKKQYINPSIIVEKIEIQTFLDEISIVEEPTDATEPDEARRRFGEEFSFNAVLFNEY